MKTKTPKIASKTPPQKGCRINKEKALVYLKEYTENGFNKTQAYSKVAPENQYASNNANAPRFHNLVMVDDSLLTEFNLDKVTVELIIGQLTKLGMTAKRESDRISALVMLGKWKKLFTDRFEGDIKHEVNITQEERTELQRLREHASAN